MAVTHHSDPNQFVGIQICSDRQYVCNAAWDDLEEESHISRTMNLWGQGHHRPTVGSSMRDVLETIRLDCLQKYSLRFGTDSQQAERTDTDGGASTGGASALKESAHST